jgi:peptide/nickel transport system substrate-binding protein
MTLMPFFTESPSENPLTTETFITRASKQEFSAFAAQYGAEDSINSLRALVATYDMAKGYGTANRTRYSNPVVDNLLTESLTTMDDELRQKKLDRAINFAMADQPLIPVFFPIFDFAARQGLVITPRAPRRFNALMVAPAR